MLLYALFRFVGLKKEASFGSSPGTLFAVTNVFINEWAGSNCNDLCRVIGGKVGANISIYSYD